MTPAKAFAMVLSTLALPALAAGECTVRTGPYRNPLVELYTSEGCSSCPPADRWLSAIAPDATQPSVVPIAFHVGYWDYIGWKDAFADARFTQRQRVLAEAAARPNVYTPQVILNGRDTPGWHSSGTLDALRTAREPAKATIEITRRADPAAVVADLRVELPAAGSTANLELVVAVTQDRLSSRVTAGENRGATLSHQHVARDIATFPVGARRDFKVRFDPKADWKLPDTRVVAFLQDRKTGEVLQSASACGG